MEQPGTQTEDQASLWQFVPPEDRQVPSPEIEQRVRTGITDLWKKIRPKRARETPEPTDWEPLPASRRRRWAPPPDWSDALPALRPAIESASQPVMLVTPPYSGTAALVDAWGEEDSRRRRITPPTHRQILEGAEEWLSGLQAGDSPWVLPRLQRCYLRHIDGLQLVRDFLDRWTDGRLGRGLVGCDRWAWNYLRHVWTGRMPRLLTLQSFDAERIARWFRSLSKTDDRPTSFRLADTDRKLLEPPEAEERDRQADDEHRQESEFLHNLAAYSRGIPGVALSLWRRSFVEAPSRESPSEEVDENVVWVRPWNRMDLPTLPEDAAGDEALILHALLLHAGCPVEILAEILPMNARRIRGTLSSLDEHGVAGAASKTWRVAAAGYPAARRFLDGLNYPTGDP